MASKVEELLQEINDTLEDTANSLNPAFHREFIGLDDVLAELITAARAEGAEQERVKIVRGGQRFHQHDDVADSDYISTHYGTEIDTVVADCDLFVIPRSVLAPTKEKPERGKPSQALLDELSNICGGKVEYEPKAQP